MDEQNHCSQDDINKLQEVATLQQYLFNLTEENYISTISFFDRSQYILDSVCHDIFLRNLFWAFQLRPKSISKLFDLFIWFISNEDITTHTTIIATILTFYNRCQLNFEAHSKFIYNFFNGIFKILDESFDPKKVNSEYIAKLIKMNPKEIETIKKEISFLMVSISFGFIFINFAIYSELTFFGSNDSSSILNIPLKKL